MVNSGLVVAITGGTGFIGRRLVDLHVRRGDAVRVLSRRALPPEMCAMGVTGFTGDLSGQIPADFARHADVLYHCAAELGDASRCWSSNADGTSCLLQAAEGVGRWVQLSSIGVYGPKQAGVVTENSPTLPHNFYERSKAEADQRLIKQGRAIGLDYVILRPSNVFGPGMPNRSLRQLSATIRRGLFCLVGPPGASANYIFVENVVAGLFLCATHPQAPGRVFNLSDWRSMEDFVAAIAATLQVRAPHLRLPAAMMRWLASGAQYLPGRPLTPGRIDALTGRATYPADRIVAELGYHHAVTMEEGLARTLADFFPELRGDVR
jgi:nucleoside-diphosphate-sugar epimerase